MIRNAGVAAETAAPLLIESLQSINGSLYQVQISLVSIFGNRFSQSTSHSLSKWHLNRKPECNENNTCRLNMIRSELV
jgi:hypothetical protein